VCADNEAEAWAAIDMSCCFDPNYAALDEVLERLAALDARKARVVELRFFGGLSVQESAKVLNVSEVGCVAKRFSGQTQPTSFIDGLAFQSESFSDELNLSKYIAFRQPPHLALPDHVQNLVALNRSPRSIE
jgi:hypothetical protein